MGRRGLIVREPYASWIVQGIKKWEIRKHRTHVRDTVYIISSGRIIGYADLVDVLGPFSVDELAEYYEYHRVDRKFLEEYSRGKKLYAWVFENARMLKEPVRVKVPRGAIIWVKIGEEIVKVLEERRRYNKEAERIGCLERFL